MPFSLEKNDERGSILLTQLLTEYLDIDESDEMFIYDDHNNKITL